MSPPAIDYLEIETAHEGVAPGDDTVFITVRGAGAVGSYGPVSERIGAYTRDTLASTAQGADVTDHVGLSDALRAVARTAPSASASWAVGAVDCAVWDLHGHLVGRSVAELLAASSPRSSVAAYASWLSRDLSDVKDLGALRTIAADGWSFTKWGLRRAPRDSYEEAAARMARATEQCAEALGVPVAVDAVGTWTPSVTMTFARSVNATCLRWLEDPLPRHDLDTYDLLAFAQLPLAVGERAHCDEDLAGLVQYIRPTALTLDVVGCGGLTRAVQVLAMARTHAVPVYPHGRSFQPGLHLAAAFPDAVPAVEYRLQWEPRRQRLYEIPAQPEHGHIRLPDAPGLGTTRRRTPWPAHL